VKPLPKAHIKVLKKNLPIFGRIPKTRLVSHSSTNATDIYNNCADDSWIVSKTGVVMQKHEGRAQANRNEQAEVFQRIKRETLTSAVKKDNKLLQYW